MRNIRIFLTYDVNLFKVHYFRKSVNMTINKFIKSPLNYTGGKHRLLDQIIPLFPENIETFYDLFSGGSNVGINVKATSVKFIDYNDYLIDLFQYFQKNSFEEIITQVENKIEKYNLSKTNQEGYLRLREDFNNKKEILDLYVLICFSFNHMVRFNNNHKFNTPFGKNRSSFTSSMKNKLKEFVMEIQKSKYQFINSDFEINLSELNGSDFIYCDPPYLITTASYNDGKRGFDGWSAKHEERLLKFLKNASDSGIRFALSNVIEHDDKKNKILIKWINENNFKVNYLDASYKNSSYNKISRSKSSEVLITNYN